MIVPYGTWTPEQTAAALLAIESHPAHVQGSLPFKTSPAVVWRRLKSNEIRGALIHGYLCLYDIGPTWCSDDVLLHEYMTMRAMLGGSFGEYIDGLRLIASMNDCVGIITGNGVLRPGLRRLYEREGFVQQNEAFYLGV